MKLDSFPVATVFLVGSLSFCHADLKCCSSIGAGWGKGYQACTFESRTDSYFTDDE